MSQLSVLLIEDSKADFVLTREMLADVEGTDIAEGTTFDLTWADRLTVGLQHLGKKRFDVILLDLSLPDAHGLDAFFILRAVSSNIPVLVLTGFDDRRTALNAVHAGAQDYLVKGTITGDALLRAICHAIERARILGDLESAKEEAERANRAKTEFLITVSEELSAPLKGTMRLAKAILEGAGLDADNHERVEAVRQGSLSMLKLLSSITDFARVESDRLALHSTEFSLRGYLEQVVGLLQGRAGERGVKLHTLVRPDVPDRYVGDCERLQQVLTNLIESALRLGRGEGPLQSSVTVACEVQSTSGDETVLHFSVTVSDIEIPMEEQRKVFESFAQADASVLRKYGGSGLTLALSSKLVELMGGRAWVKSETTNGTAFHFTIRLGTLPAIDGNEEKTVTYVQ